MNNIVKNALFLFSGALLLSCNLDAAARRIQAPAKAAAEAKGAEGKEEKKEEKKEAQTDCTICITSFEEDKDPQRTLRCGHIFHAKCIDRSLAQDNRCPNCRQPHDDQRRRIRPENPLEAFLHDAGQNAQNGQPIFAHLPAPARCCLYAILCCLMCPRAPHNLVRR